MRTSKRGIELIKSFEGCYLNAYKCPAGVWTIGYGHTEDVVPKQVITKEQAEEFLVKDLEKYEKYVKNNVTILLGQSQFDALVSFTYNCGVGNLRNLVKNRNCKQIADALLFYNKAGGKVFAGLARRRNAERELFLEQIEKTIKYYPNCKQEECGIERALISIGVEGSYKHRCKIAASNGIEAYRGTAEQNKKLLSLLKEGKLIQA